MEQEATSVGIDLMPNTDSIVISLLYIEITLFMFVRFELCRRKDSENK